MPWTGGDHPAKPLRLKSVDASRALPFQKTANMISNLKARAISQKQGFDDALMINGGIVTEGSTWNIFFGLNDRLFTPSLKSGILPGITRRLIIENSGGLGFEVVEDELRLKAIDNYKYCFATNAAAGMATVCSIDGFEFDAASNEIESLKAKHAAIIGDKI